MGEFDVLRAKLPQTKANYFCHIKKRLQNTKIIKILN